MTDKLTNKEKAIITALENGDIIRAIDYRLGDSFVSPAFVQFLLNNGTIREVEIQGMKFYEVNK